MQLSQGEKQVLLYTGMFLVLVLFALMATCGAHAQGYN
jgi:hypothetical protein